MFKTMPIWPIHSGSQSIAVQFSPVCALLASWVQHLNPLSAFPPSSPLNICCAYNCCRPSRGHCPMAHLWPQCQAAVCAALLVRPMTLRWPLPPYSHVGLYYSVLCGQECAKQVPLDVAAVRADGFLLGHGLVCLEESPFMA